MECVPYSQGFTREDDVRSSHQDYPHCCRTQTIKKNTYSTLPCFYARWVTKCGEWCSVMDVYGWCWFNNFLVLTHGRDKQSCPSERGCYGIYLHGPSPKHCTFPFQRTGICNPEYGMQLKYLTVVRTMLENEMFQKISENFRNLSNLVSK